ncbi:hypothetical protein DPSP01_010881 [Paraphaeosphaeria sporulosa]|uniref:STEEP1 domain-containing protein n=1 Tax=Paraphaeosphaeria sporulosa TaxID=1460663 RepID=A0A177C0S2_9PLEO|nr:uncharacterized protein CC84DRAFT_190727 [Paraphaeosphaeria sporulosa]OAG01394.1 hypothetical protein CC84DRAFT_190727 [Paraphaeosphaeria sporulosa]
MDITQSSRDYFAMPSPSPSEKLSLAASSTVYTYHCLCTHLLLATSTPLHALPTRNNSADAAHIMPLPPPPAPTTKARRGSNEPVAPPTDHYGLLLSTRLENAASMVTSDSGFEKRYLQRCGRCNLVVGYQLDWQQFGGERTGRKDDVVYLLPEGFVTTSEMIMGKTPPKTGGIGMVTVAEIKT